MERVADVAEEFADHPIVKEIVAFIRAGGKRSLYPPKLPRRDSPEGGVWTPADAAMRAE